tara:strand:+ start:15868 stop:16953 length:1086 start_codon:yes stop_codon:yes gene_type:complete
MNYLDFEKDLETLDKSLEKLKNPFNQEEGLSTVNSAEISDIENKIKIKIEEIYSNLDGWKKTMLARHEFRPKSQFYISSIFDNFQKLSGDRNFGEDQSVITGFATIKEKSVLVIGQEKGNDTESRINRNFGMMKPEGYRKCIRLMRLAENYNIPVITMIDTPGAFPGKGAEERGQAEAIAQSINCCLNLKVPIISIVIGEGGSGGAIALATSNKVFMLEHAIYSVISPEGCASILWKDATKSKDAADAMHLTAQDLYKHKIIDQIIDEPKGGAHRHPELMAKVIKDITYDAINFFESKSSSEIIQDRKDKFINIGQNLDTDIVSFESIRQVDIKSRLIKNKNKILLGFSIFVIIFFLFKIF